MSPRQNGLVSWYLERGNRGMKRPLKGMCFQCMLKWLNAFPSPDWGTAIGLGPLRSMTCTQWGLLIACWQHLKLIRGIMAEGGHHILLLWMIHGGGLYGDAKFHLRSGFSGGVWWMNTSRPRWIYIVDTLSWWVYVTLVGHMQRQLFMLSQNAHMLI